MSEKITELDLYASVCFYLFTVHLDASHIPFILQNLSDPFSWDEFCCMYQESG